jgi:colanic acid/amylovoran biosynthesis protein
MTEAIAQSEFVVATRFHATILALAAGRPVLPVVYSDKTLHVLEDLGFDGGVIDLRKDEDYTAFDKPGYFDVEQQKKNAQKHFEKLDQVLGKNEM